MSLTYPTRGLDRARLVDPRAQAYYATEYDRYETTLRNLDDFVNDTELVRIDKRTYRIYCPRCPHQVYHMQAHLPVIAGKVTLRHRAIIDDALRALLKKHVLKAHREEAITASEYAHAEAQVGWVLSRIISTEWVWFLNRELKWPDYANERVHHSFSVGWFFNFRPSLRYSCQFNPLDGGEYRTLVLGWFKLEHGHHPHGF